VDAVLGQARGGAGASLEPNGHGPGTYKGGTDQYVNLAQPSAWHAPGDPELLAEGGMCVVAVRTQFTAGTVTVTAQSPGLADGAIAFQLDPISGPSL
jgi:beta-galactosidase